MLVTTYVWQAELIKMGAKTDVTLFLANTMQFATEIVIAEWEAAQIIVQCGVRISFFSCIAQQCNYSDLCAWSRDRNEVGCREEEEINQGTSATTLSSRERLQSQQQHEADQCGHNLIHPYIAQPLVVAASDGVAALVSWLIYKCSDTIEQRMISRASNDEGLTDDTVTYAN